MELSRWAAVDAPLSGLFCDRAQIIRRPGWVQVVSEDLHLAARNEVLWSVVDTAEIEATIDRTIATYRAIGTPFKWSLPQGSQPLDLGTRLRERGFSGWQVRAMACAADHPIEARPSVRTHALELANLEEFVALSNQGWDVAPSLHTRFCLEHRRGLRSGRLIGVLAFSHGEAVGTASAIVSGTRGYLAGGQVLPRARGQGIYRALLRSRLHALAARGVREVVTLAREQTSAPILAKLGFRTLFNYQIYQRDADG